MGNNNDKALGTAFDYLEYLVVARRNVESTRQTIELALQFFRCHVGSAQIFKVVIRKLTTIWSEIY